MDAQAIATDQANQLLAMIGPHGLFAIVLSIFMVRAVRGLFYTTRAQSTMLAIAVSAVVGVGTTFSYVEGASFRQLFAGVFMTPLASIAVYHLLRYGLALAYEKLQWETIRAFYFFLCPSNIKIKDSTGETLKIPPHSELTQIFNKARVDK